MWLWISGFLSCARVVHNNEKLCAETGDLAMTHDLVDVTIGDRFSWEWSNRSELWDLVAVRNLFARCCSSSCLV